MSILDDLTQQYSADNLLRGALRPYGFSPPPRVRGQQQEPPAIPPLSPEEEDSMLSRIGSNSLSGLAWAGNFLDTPGSVVRGVLHGTPDRALSGITDWSQRVSGNELLHQSPDTPFFSGEGLGAFGAEIATDPLTYLSLGGSAVNKLGRTAKAAGVLPKALTGRLKGLAAGSEELTKLAKAAGRPEAELVGKSLGGVAGIGLPFRPAAVTLGEGQTGLNFLKNVVDPIGKYSGLSALGKAVAPIGRGLASLFDKSTFGTVTETGQTAARNAFEQMSKGLPRARQDTLDLLKSLETHGVADHTHELLDAMEGKLIGPARPGVQAAMGEIQPKLEKMLAREQELGIPIGKREDYFPRYKTPLDVVTPGFSPGLKEGLSAFHPSQLGREEILDLPGGRNMVNELVRDPQLKAMLGTGTDMQRANAIGRMGGQIPPDLAAVKPNKLQAAQHIRYKYLGADAAEDSLRQQLHQAAQAGQASPEDLLLLGTLDGKAKQAEQLADWLQALDPQYAAKGLDFFGNHVATDFLTRALGHQRAVAHADALQSMLAAAARPATEALPGSVRLDEALARLGLGRDGKATQEAVAQLGKRMVDVGKISQPGEVLNQFVDPKILADAARVHQTFTTPAAIQGVVKLWDSITNATKTMLTSLWPAFHSRNAATGLWMNFVGDALNPKAYGAAMQIHKGQVVPWLKNIPALKGMTPEQATRQIAEWGFTYRLTGGREGLFADLAGMGEHWAQGQRPVLPGPGNVQKGPLATYLGGFGDLLNPSKPLEEKLPWNLPGVGNRRAGGFAPAQAGREAGAQVDEISRMGGFIELLRKGWDPEAAAKRVMELHYDYSRLAPFERQVMRRIVPFYSWARSNVPFVLRNIAEQPGGKMATAVKAGAKARGDEPGFLPDWLGEGLALPLGGPSAGGDQRFLTGTGLPFEDVAQMLNPRGMLSQLNPIIKFPLEQATNTQLYTGRQLSDLHGLSGNTTMDQLLYNSPISRFVTSGRILADQRKDVGTKALNLLTGVRAHDINLDRQRDIASRDYLQQELEHQPGVRNFTRSYVPQEMLGNIDPHTLALLRLQASRDQRLRAQRNPG